MVSVLCPGMVSTNITSHARVVGDDQKEVNEMELEGEKLYKAPGVITSDQVAQITIRAMKENRFFIFTNPEYPGEGLAKRGQDIQKLEKHLQDTFKG